MKKLIKSYWWILLVILSPFILYYGAIFTLLGYMSYVDFKYDKMMEQIQKDCIETKISKGYPKDFAEEYCSTAGEGCVEKGYEENCRVGVICCFATIEEDKKWNYLDYDKNENKKK